MNHYLHRLCEELEEYGSSHTIIGNGSVLELLWQCYAELNPVDDGRIKLADNALSQVLLDMTPKEADMLFDLVSDWCSAYQRAAFLEGVHLGICLKGEPTS